MLRFDQVGVLPEPGDNAAICSRRLDAGTELDLVIPPPDLRAPDQEPSHPVPAQPTPVTLPHTVLEGHRFVIRPVRKGEAITSWGTPFARALRDLKPGDYVCTPTSLAAVQARGVPGLPEQPTAENEPLDPYRLDERLLHLGEQVPLVDQPRTFLGYPRQQGPAGTRNHVVLLATSSRSSGFVTELARRFQGADAGDGVVPVAHTEGGEDEKPNNLDLLLRTLAGFTLNPNVGAVLVVDDAADLVSGQAIREYLATHGYPPIRVPHAYFTRQGGFERDLTTAGALIEPWLPVVAAQERAEVPLTDLRIALQCGGSDAFSGISANPLAGAVGREVIRHGGAAILAETDELIGAEGYVLKNVRDLATARRFLRTVASFKDRVGWHGHTAEGNPSGGNVYRGLYNIVLKSIGAARKLPREVRLDHVVDYGEPLPGSGYVFMDSPGNDLESVAGQVASGCNLIFFTTGNGSITNFPFVPTLKFVTTSARYEQLSAEMDVDAGRYLTGTPMDELTAETFDLTVRVASGERSAGERAGHSQVSIWRNWRQSGPREGISISTDGRSKRDLADLPAEERDALLPGKPVPVEAATSVEASVVSAGAGPLRLLEADGRLVPEQVGLLLPTSLCSGQIALRLAAQAELERWAGDAVTRMVALPHTEGCGSSGGASEETYSRIMLGYLLHPNTRLALLLEHGCEKTHNDYFRSRLIEAGADPSRFGWASIQADGGIEAVGTKVRAWFESFDLPAPTETEGTLGALTVGLEARGPLTNETAEAMALIGREIVAAGGSVVLSSRGALLANSTFRTTAFAADPHGTRFPHTPDHHAPGMPPTSRDLTPSTSHDPGSPLSSREPGSPLASREPGSPLTPYEPRDRWEALDAPGLFLAGEDAGRQTGGSVVPDPTVAHGQRFSAPGWHVMRMPGTDWMETATGFGAGGVQLILAHVAGGTLSAQRFVPVGLFSHDPETVAQYGDDLDAVAPGDAREQARAGLELVADIAGRRAVPKAVASGNVGFQITRGLLGTSM